jgi:coniferyl-aldehyde dehydrogenase
MVEDGEAQLAEAISADFGNRSRIETRLTDILLVVSQTKLALRRIARWSRTRRVTTPIYMWPGTSKLLPQPLGVVGVIGAWNYPVATILGPAGCALAAGNRVVLKPSEQAPRTAEVLAGMIADRFAPEVLSVVLGGTDVATRFAALKFDHLVFTGSGAVGRKVAAAAAANLTPVTLELGGKCPAILDTSCNLDEAVSALLFGKFLNAGQTCIGVDYVLCPQAMQERLVLALRKCVTAAFPNWAENPDYTHILSQRHLARLEALLADARAKGASVQPLVPEMRSNGRAFQPTVVLGATEAMRLTQEEIFGPILPIVTCQTHDDAIAYINSREKPLALYWMGRNARIRDQVMAKTFSGGATVNGAVMPVYQQNFGFGGVGPSGMGEYLGGLVFAASRRRSQFTYNVARTLSPCFRRPTRLALNCC